MLSGSPPASQAKGRGFEARRPLHTLASPRMLSPAQAQIQAKGQRREDATRGTSDAPRGRIEVASGLNELGVPDFRSARANTTARPIPERSPLNGCNLFTPHCFHCNYPLVKTDRACPRCGRSR